MRVDTVHDSDVPIALGHQHAFQAGAKRRRERLFGVARTHRGRDVAESDSGFQEAELAPEFPAFKREHAPIESQRWNRVARKQTLIREVVNREHLAG